MSTAAARVAFLDEQLTLLAPFESLMALLPKQPYAAVEVARAEDGGLVATLMPRPPEAAFAADQAARVAGLGFVLDGPLWRRHAPIDGALIDRILREVFGAGDDAMLDVHHANHQAEHEAMIKLAAVRERLGPMLTEFLGHAPETDPDGDFVFDWDSTQVFVAPRVMPGAPVVIRVFAITNVGVNVSPELALFIARMNFGLLFGRFALDLEHASVWFSESLLGEYVADEEFRYTVRTVAETANEWDDQIAQMFGGFTHATAPTTELASDRTKPGSGGNGGYI